MILLCILALLLAILAPAYAALPASAPFFDLPDGFVIDQMADEPESTDWRPLVTVRPADGPFSGLSSIRLRQVVGRVDNPDAWLNERVTADVGDGSAAAQALGSPDSPFADPAFDALREAIPKLFAGLERLGEMPLSFCEGPNTAYNAAGPLRELYCVYSAGPLRQYLTVRLQEAGSNWYYTQIRAVNERRFRHLIAIANSFRPAP